MKRNSFVAVLLSFFLCGTAFSQQVLKQLLKRLISGSAGWNMLRIFLFFPTQSTPLN